MTKEFENGKKYERLESSKFNHLFQGYFGALMSLILIFLFFTDIGDNVKQTKEWFWIIIILMIYTICNFVIGYSDKKYLEELKNDNNG